MTNLTPADWDDREFPPAEQVQCAGTVEGERCMEMAEPETDLCRWCEAERRKQRGVRS